MENIFVVIALLQMQQEKLMEVRATLVQQRLNIDMHIILYGLSERN